MFLCFLAHVFMYFLHLVPTFTPLHHNGKGSIGFIPHRTMFWPFLHCLDCQGEEPDLQLAEKCANDQSMNWAAIDACTTGDLGHKSVDDRVQLRAQSYTT